MPELLDEALNLLGQGYRCEYVYKAALVNRIVFGRHSPRTASLLSELPVGRSIVDIAVFNGTSTAYEIKTELDTERRLATQTPDYLRAFERVYLVTHPGLVSRYVQSLDPRVGILALNQRGSLAVVREADASGDALQKDALFTLLRAGEYVHAMAQVFGKQRPMPNGERYRHYRALWEQMPVRQAHGVTVEALRARTTSPSQVEFVSELPASLRVLGYATPLSMPQRQRVLAALAH